MRSRLAAAIVLAAALVAGCSPTDHEKLKAEVVAADKAFCAASVKDGPEAAFVGAIAADGKLLGEPRVGADAVHAVYMQFPKTAKLTWEPSYADVSASGDLGYTWGRYTLTVPSSVAGKPPLIRMGSYVTVWKRQPGGGWKFVLDGGAPDREAPSH